MSEPPLALPRRRPPTATKLIVIVFYVYPERHGIVPITRLEMHLNIPDQVDCQSGSAGQT